MDESDLARRAVERRVITEDQLKEAQSFAEGGRSLLSVLLDLGYLRAEHLPGLMDTAPRASPRPRRGVWLAAGFILGTACFLMLSTGGCPSKRPAVSPPVSAPRDDGAQLAVEIEELKKRLANPDRPAFEQLRSRGLQFLREAEAIVRSSGRLTPEATERFQDAAVLLDAAVPLGPLSAEDFASVGRAREALLEWPRAYYAYTRALQANPRHSRALLGAARAALELGKNAEALKYAQNAVTLNPTAEAYLLRGRARIQSEQKDAGRQDLIKARSLEPSLAPIVANLLEKLDRP